MLKIKSGVFQRIEKKYLLTYEQYNSIVEELQKHMVADNYNESGGLYSVLSLYYDTPDYDLIRELFSISQFKEKLRLRTYGKQELDDLAYLEIKRKVNGVSSKRRCSLQLQEAYRFMESGRIIGVGDEANLQVFREIQAILHRNKMKLRPTALIRYNRVAFNGKDGETLRISFDTELRSRTYDLRIELGGYGQLLLGPQYVLMEIKALGSMPLWLTHALASQRLFATGFSKYRTLYKNLLEKKKEVAYA